MIPNATRCRFHDLPFELAISIAALAAPRVAVLASTRILADTARLSTSALLHWIDRTLPFLLAQLERGGPTKLVGHGWMRPWQSGFASYVRLRFAARHRTDLPVEPKLDLALFHAFLFAYLRSDPASLAAVPRARQQEHLDALSHDVVVKSDSFFHQVRPIHLQGFMSDGLVLALYFEAAECTDELAAALTLMARHFPAVSFNRALPASRLLELLPDCSPCMYERVSMLAGELREEREPRRVDFFTLVAFSAACHWNLPALKAAAALHPDLSSVMAFLSHHRVANAFLGLINEYPADRVLSVLDWLFAHGFSLLAEPGPEWWPIHISSYLSPLSFGPDVLRTVFRKYDEARPLDVDKWGTTKRVLGRLAPWVEQGYDRELAQLLRAWPGVTDARVWAVLVMAAIHAHCPIEQLRRMVHVVAKEQRDALLTELFTHEPERYNENKSHVARLCLLARACTKTPLSQLLATALVSIGDGTFGPDLGSLGLGSREERLALARSLLGHAFPVLHEPNCAHALIGILVPLLTSPSSARAALHHLAGKRERDWTELYASFISAMAGSRYEVTDWVVQVAAPLFLVTPDFFAAFANFLAVCPAAIVTPALRPRVTQDLIDIARLADPRYHALSFAAAEFRGREVSAGQRFLHLLVAHAPVAVGGLWFEVGESLLPLIARYFPPGALDAFVAPRACAEAIVWEARRDGKVHGKLILQIIRACPATARDPECLRIVAKAVGENDKFDRHVVQRVPGLARAMREAVESKKQGSEE
ncbi:hypothetical protein H9P43_000264 [Blastocladiella emersonii ATCC 22665]|nr:hypothetical protein H9P43_000264 [Blastocladiella emersonii ATCC 22665]